MPHDKTTANVVPLKQHTFIIAQFLWVRSLGTDALGLLKDDSQGVEQGGRGSSSEVFPGERICFQAQVALGRLQLP